MAFVPGYKHDIFVSYARVNDDPPEGADKGWVTTFVNGLKRELAQRLGRADAYSLWMDHELVGNISITSEIMDNVSNSATLIVVLSQAYLASPWCQKEESNFLRAVQERRVRTDSRVFVVELDKSKRPPEFGDLRGYRFFTEDPVARHPHLLGWPQPQLKEQKYYDMITDLSYDLKDELQKLKTSAELSNEEMSEVPTRATVFLADVTDDLLSKRDDVKRYLTQANLRVLPETYYSLEPNTFQNAVQTDLTKSDLFVQLLSAFPGKRPPYLPKGCARFQHDLAQKLGKPILQWRSPELNLSKVQDPDQRALLQSETVYAVGIEEFKAEIKKKVSPPPPPPPPPPEKPLLVFVNKHPNDIKLADDICQTLRKTFHIRFSNPQPSANSKLVERWILRSDGVIIIYGDVDTEWVETQYLDMFDFFSDQKQVDPFSALTVYDGPPEDKPELTFDCQILKCRDCLKDEEIRKFVIVLRSGGTP